MRFRPLDLKDPLEEGMAPHSSILAWNHPMGRGAWWATVPGVAESNQTVLQWLGLGLLSPAGRQSLPLAKQQSGKLRRSVCGNHCPFLSSFPHSPLPLVHPVSGGGGYI